jgi:RNase P protein component
MKYTAQLKGEKEFNETIDEWEKICGGFHPTVMVITNTKTKECRMGFIPKKEKACEVMRNVLLSDYNW